MRLRYCGVFQTTTWFSTLSLHDALPIYKFSAPVLDVWCEALRAEPDAVLWLAATRLLVTENLRREVAARRSEEHTSELQSLRHIVCRLMPVNKKGVATE